MEELLESLRKVAAAVLILCGANAAAILPFLATRALGCVLPPVLVFSVCTVSIILISVVLLFTVKGYWKQGLLCLQLFLALTAVLSFVQLAGAVATGWSFLRK
jgi:hypothetical protein